MKIRPYNPATDRDAVHRIWREVGWFRKEQEEGADLFLTSGDGYVAEVNGEAECMALIAPGGMRYLSEELPFAGVTSVATSRVARRQGAARRVTAAAVAHYAVNGAHVVGLGMFEQGYYNQVGFGTGGYEHIACIDPARLGIRVKARVPRRLTADDAEAVHASRLHRGRGHGSIILASPLISKSEMVFAPNAFGLGYFDGPDGELTHHAYFRTDDVSHGPYRVLWMAYRTPAQLLELLAIIRSLGDQVRQVRLREPPGIQLQDLVEQPFKQRQMTEGSRFESHVRAAAYWQARICDLPGCLSRTHLATGEVRFNLRLSDPIERYLDEDAPWGGAAGEYVVTLGRSSGAEPGTDEALPTLSASVGAFTRLWLGVRRATGLAVTDDLAAPPGLMEALESLLCLPEPRFDWDF